MLVNLKSTCFFTSDSGMFFFLLFQKNGSVGRSVGRSMGNETFYGDALIGSSNSIFLSPESDQCQIFPCIFFALKDRVIMRIEDMIT